MYARLPFVAALVAVVLLAGCSGIEVRSDWDRDVDFSRYHTYRWAPSKDPQAARSFLDRRIRRAVDAELETRGFAKRESGPADLLVVYRAATRDRVDVWDSPYHRRWGAGPGAYRWRENTLLLEVVDLADQAVVWQGWGSAPLGDAETRDEDVREIVAKILQRFPPSTG